MDGQEPQFSMELEPEAQAQKQLIEHLLNCAAGEEQDILTEQHTLVNPQLLAIMVQRARELQERGDKHRAMWLMQLVEQWAKAMGLGDADESEADPTDSEAEDEGEGRTRSLQDFYLRVSGLSFTEPTTGRREIKAFIKQRHRYTGPADIWFNLAAETGRLQLTRERGLVVEEGLKEHPESIDLLCEVLQGSCGLYLDPAKARETWSKLEALEESRFYWRYWVYGATYHARLLKDQEKALALLDQGLCRVSSDHLNNIVRAYRPILIDNPPNPGIESRDQRQRYEEASFERLEKIYKWAISLGIEDNYELAVGLAKLYQERAEFNSVDADTNDHLLEQSLHYLSLAEARYTASSNHPIWEIYLPRARIYIVQKKYVDAFKIFNALPEQIVESDPSVRVQKAFAAHMIGIEDDDKKRG